MKFYNAMIVLVVSHFLVSTVGSGQKLTPIPPEVVQVVVRQELLSSTAHSEKPICLTINASDPKKKLIDSLRKQGLQVRMGSVCVREQRGLILILAGIGSQGGLEVLARLGDPDLTKQDFGTLLSEFRYSFRKSEEGKWELIKRTKKCCDETEEQKLTHGPGEAERSYRSLPTPSAWGWRPSGIMGTDGTLLSIARPRKLSENVPSVPLLPLKGWSSCATGRLLRLVAGPEKMHRRVHAAT